MDNVNDAKRLVLLLLRSYGRPMERRALYAHVYELSKELSLDLGFSGKYPYSRLLDQELSRMVEEGLIKRLYVVGPRFAELYREYFELTEKGEEFVEEIGDPELERAVESYASRVFARQGEQTGTPSPDQAS